MQHEFLVNVELEAVLAFALQELEARPLGFEFWVGALGHFRHLNTPLFEIVTRLSAEYARHVPSSDSGGS